MTAENTRQKWHYLTHCLTRLTDSSQSTKDGRLAAIEAAVTLLETGKSPGGGHSSEVAFIAWFIAHRLGLAPPEQDKIKLAALVHDLGKVKSEEYPGQHAFLGAQIICTNPHLGEVADMVRFHHTRWQGAAAIPLGARIIAVADAFQRALASQPANSTVLDRIILNRLRLRAGGDLDPAAVSIVAGNYELLSRFVSRRPLGGRPNRKCAHGA